VRDGKRAAEADRILQSLGERRQVRRKSNGNYAEKSNAAVHERDLCTRLEKKKRAIKASEIPNEEENWLK